MNFLNKKLEGAHFEVLAFLDANTNSNIDLAARSEDSTSIITGTYTPVISGDTIYKTIDNMLNNKLRTINIESPKTDSTYIDCNSIKYNPEFTFGDDIMSLASRSAYTGHPRYENMKRFLPIEIHRGGVNGILLKITVDVPLQLDMSRYFVQDLVSPKRYLYTLKSFTVHKGREVNTGHYIAYILDAESDEWYLFDDVRAPQRVIDMNEMMKHLREEANILFYESA